MGRRVDAVKYLYQRYTNLSSSSPFCADSRGIDQLVLRLAIAGFDATEHFPPPDQISAQRKLLLKYRPLRAGIWFSVVVGRSCNPSA